MTIEALNYILDDNEEVYSNKSKETFKDIECLFHFAVAPGKMTVE